MDISRLTAQAQEAAERLKQAQALTGALTTASETVIQAAFGRDMRNVKAQAQADLASLNIIECVRRANAARALYVLYDGQPIEAAAFYLYFYTLIQLHAAYIEDTHGRLQDWTFLTNVTGALMAWVKVTIGAESGTPRTLKETYFSQLVELHRFANGGLRD